MLDIKKSKKEMIKYLFISIFFLIFSIVYESFSHDVYSNYMMYAFVIPLILGTLIYGIIYIFELNKSFNEFGMKLYNSSIITFTLGSIMKGVLEIYGTTNKLTIIYLIIGIITLIISIIINIVYKKGRKN